MNHFKHTWNHIKLFAQMCDCQDDDDTVTENWIQMLEKQHESVFPFTLWPLTYRTSAVIFSPSLSSPTVKTLTLVPQQCRLIVKFYRSNEVIMICFQHESLKNTRKGSHTCPCMKWCRYEGNNIDPNHGQHSNNQKISLVKCAHMTMFSKVKKKVLTELAKYRQQDNDSDNQPITIVICMGYDKGAVLAALTASELASNFKIEAEFLGQECSQVSVDCISFSIPETGNEVYWDDFDKIVDSKIHVKYCEEEWPKCPKTCIFVGNNKYSKRTNFSIMGWKSRGSKTPTCKNIIDSIENHIHPI